MATTTKKQVPAKQEQTQVPAYLKVPADQHTGAENIGAGDFIMPRLKICQDQSRDAKKVGVPAGNFYNSISFQNYGPAVELFIILAWKGRVCFAKDRSMVARQYEDINTLIWESMGDTERANNGIDEKDKIPFKNKWKDTYEYMVVSRRELQHGIKTGQAPMFAIFSCMSASMKCARKVNTTLKFNEGRRVPIWGQPLKLKSGLEQFEAGDAFLPNPEFKDYATENENEVLKGLHESARSFQSRHEVHEEPVPAKETPPAQTPAAATTAAMGAAKPEPSAPNDYPEDYEGESTDNSPDGVMNI